MKEIDWLIKEKNFETIWHCLDFLIISGYPLFECFNLSLKHFGEERLISDTAFLKISAHHPTQAIVNHLTGQRVEILTNYSITIGVLSDKNKHLERMYKVYIKCLVDKKVSTSDLEIEKTCDIVVLPNVPYMLKQFIDSIFQDKRYNVIET